MPGKGAAEHTGQRGGASGAPEHAAKSKSRMDAEQAARILEQADAVRNGPHKQGRQWLQTLKQQVSDATHVPLTRAHFVRECCKGPGKKPRIGGVWPTSMQAISRSVAAYNRAASASEHGACDEIAASICGYAHTLCLRTDRQDEFVNLLHSWIVNRAANVALKRTLEAALETSLETCWQHFHTGERNRAVQALETSLETVRTSGDTLRTRMDSLRAW